jgi:hypothetical protein
VVELEQMLERFLGLQFGKNRVINVTPLTEMLENSKPSFVFNVHVDKDEAVVSVLHDGTHWVRFS